MYPKFYITDWLSIYTFGLCMIVAWAVFFYLLYRFSMIRGFTRKNICIESIVGLTVSIFFGSRICYILMEWVSEQWLFRDLFETGNIFVFLKKFFITDNYSLSFAGGVIGFVIFFVIKNWGQKNDHKKYIDIIVPAFLIAAIVGYLGALLGGQLYGSVSSFIWTITYTNPETIVPLQNPTFPLPVIYMILCGLIAYGLYHLEKKGPFPDGFIGLVGGGCFSIMLFLLEFMNGSVDIFGSKFGINLTQIVSICIIAYTFIGIFRIMKP